MLETRIVRAVATQLHKVELYGHKTAIFAAVDLVARSNILNIQQFPKATQFSIVVGLLARNDKEKKEKQCIEHFHTIHFNRN
jgi:hypothetical protein